MRTFRDFTLTLALAIAIYTVCVFAVQVVGVVNG